MQLSSTLLQCSFNVIFQKTINDYFGLGTVRSERVNNGKLGAFLDNDDDDNDDDDNDDNANQNNNNNRHDDNNNDSYNFTVKEIRHHC